MLHISFALGQNITLHNAYHKCIWLRNLLLNLAIFVALALFRYSRDICHFRIRFNILVLLSWQPPNVKILIFLSSSIKEGISDANKVMQKDKMHKRFEEKNILKKETRCRNTFYNVIKCFHCYFQVTLSHFSQVKDKFWCFMNGSILPLTSLLPFGSRNSPTKAILTCFYG